MATEGCRGQAASVFGDKSSTSRNVLRFVLPLVSRVLGIKASFPGTKQCPPWGSGHVIARAERLGASTLFVLQNELLEAAVIDPRPPLSINLKLQRKVVRSEVKLCIKNKVLVPSGSHQLHWLVLGQLGTLKSHFGREKSQLRKYHHQTSLW